MITLKTRSTTKDYDGFFGRTVFNWDEYSNLRREDTKFCILVKIDKTDWRIFFSKLPSARKTQMGQSIYVELAGKGQKGEPDSRRFYNLISYSLRDPLHVEATMSDIAKKFDSVFNSDFIDFFDDKRHDQKGEELLESKMPDFFNMFEGQNLVDEDNIKEGQNKSMLYVDCLTSSSKNKFLGKLSSICDRNSTEEIVLVCTFHSLSFDDVNSFCTHFVGKNIPISIFVENSNGWKLPYIKEIVPTVLDSNSKKKLLKTWLGHLLAEFLILSIAVAIGSLYNKSKVKIDTLSLQLEQLQKKDALQGTWVSEKGDAKLEIQGNSYILTGQTNYAIVGKIDYDNGRLNAQGQLHNLDQIAKEQDSTIETLESRYLRYFKQDDDFIELTDSEGKKFQLYKQE